MGRIRCILAGLLGAGSFWGVLLGMVVHCSVLAEDNTTLLLNGTTTNIGGGLTIGSTGTNNSLVILNGGSVTNTSATIGSAATADRNFAVVSNTGSLWFHSSDLVIGNLGSENQLLIYDGGLVDNNLARVGLNAGATGNTVWIDGPGSLWNVRNEMRFGENAGGNTLVITNGGLLVNGLGAFHGAIGVFAGASNNSVLVTGSGSRWTNNNSVFIGHGANGNTLTIADGGLVSTPTFMSASSSNTVIVTGFGSMISNAVGGVTVGNGGTDNLLLVTNSGLVRVVSLTVGNAASASNNTLLVTGAGSEVNLSSTLLVGNGGGNNTAIIRDGATVNAAVIGRVGLIASGSNNTILVDNATLTIGGELRFGENAGGNTLILTNGGLLVNGAGAFHGAVGVGAAAGNNTVLVTGSGSRWTNNNSVFIGHGANGNTLTISDGGLVSTPTFMLASSSNTVVVTGGGSMISNAAGGVTVGNGGTDNLLVVTNGGRVSVASITVGNVAAASNNTLLVTGSGSEVNLANTFLIGSAGGHSTAIIRDGASVNAAVIGRVGLIASGSNNTIVVDNATLTIGGEFRFGENAGGNTLIVTNGGLLVNGAGAFHGAVGLFAGNNSVLVTGSGSRWTNNTSVFVGHSANHNSLTISDGGLVSTPTFMLASSSNTVVVTGGGSMISNAAGGVTVGNGGTDNLLVVTNGGLVSIASITVGNVAAASNNTLLVTGSGTEVNLANTFLVGSAGGNNTAIIRDGASVNAAVIGRVGLIASGSNNTILVDNAALEIGGEFRFGENAGGNTMILTNGARLVTGAGAFHGAIGTLAGADNNTVIVTGSGTVWSNVSVRVGQGSSGNQLVISDGAMLVSTGASFSGFVGNVGSNNVAVVTGPGSVWTNTTSMLIGNAAHDSRLIITNGGAVYNLSGQLGNSASASNNLVVVTGNGSLWHHGVGLTVGSVGLDNRVEVRDGGAVVLASGNVNVGFQTNGSGSILVTGPGSLLRTPGIVAVGSNATTAAKGFGSLLVTDGGTLEAGTLVSGSAGSGSISNVGGIYQFATANPTITTNTAGSIAISGGTISYRAVTNANLFHAQVARISFAGDNAFRLNNASNASVASYTFDSVANTGTATNYQRLALQNGSLWRGGNLTIGTGGALDATADDQLQLTGNFIVNQTDASLFDLSAGTVSFLGGGNHTNAITGLDLGSNEVGFVTANFSYGALQLGSASDQLFFTSGDPFASSNALYVLRLDLPGNDTNLVANLHSPTSINVYYGHSALVPDNAYLNNMTYTLTGGGLLIPVIPEPSALAFALLAALGLLARRRSAGYFVAGNGGGDAGGA